MAFRQHHHTAHAAIGREMVEVAVQNRGPGHDRAMAQGAVDETGIVQIAGPPKIDEKMRAGKLHAVLLDEIIRSLFPIMNRERGIDALVAAREIRDHPQLCKCVHHVPHNQ